MPAKNFGLIWIASKQGYRLLKYSKPDYTKHKKLWIDVSTKIKWSSLVFSHNVMILNIIVHYGSETVKCPKTLVLQLYQYYGSFSLALNLRLNFISCSPVVFVVVVSRPGKWKKSACMGIFKYILMCYNVCYDRIFPQKTKIVYVVYLSRPHLLTVI